MQTTVKGKQMFLAGKWEDRGTVIKVFNPEDGRLITTVPKASAEDAVFAVEMAKRGADTAANMPVHERMAVLEKTAAYVANHRDAFIQTIVAESSKTIREARGEVERCIQTLRLSQEEARRITGETIPFDQMPGHDNRIGYYYRFPIGVIAAITPFNDPLNLVAHKIGPAIAAGNAIIVKPASLTPLSALMLAEAFEAAGLPKNVLTVLTGSGQEVGDTLVSHPAVRMVSFTGGLETGEAIARKAGLKKIGMELGSNCPTIVLDDADLSHAVDACVSGAFSTAGQNCIGVQRIYVQSSVCRTFEDNFIKKVQTLKTGLKYLEEMDMGPLINENEARRVEAWVNEAVDKGAEVLIGGKREGAFYMPTVLKNVPAGCRIAHEEIFGPVVLLYEAADLDDAIEKANHVDYGLQAGIFTNQIDAAMTAAQRLNVGGVMINDSSDYRIDSMPFGGVKGSGLGREGVKFAIQDMTEPKVVQFNLKP
ncbi:Glyceraldehyde-3-phosphate dehydrogenase (NADP(+)) [Lentibacillus sp. JNUCC-1]|uniref:aldehyde dehydrogenase family protein n=1 Tax=Lentibacillus sp. JNUCC-1 TaxID=2654513 RepID=UPI0012E97E0F|nr:aldehyde dehydrogenase family protein [Lentibacillus sp. JNUCC-1]MUV37448.1 Glyceraldehyde-3-phosphate dehydrogenase (NADP(+)) [Lentibacillus sp. JNUCC-1]